MARDAESEERKKLDHPTPPRSNVWSSIAVVARISYLAPATRLPFERNVFLLLLLSLPGRLNALRLLFDFVAVVDVCFVCSKRFALA